MAAGRAVGTGLAALTVAGCAVLVVAMTGADADRGTVTAGQPGAVPVPARTSAIPAQLPVARRPSSSRTRAHAAAAAGPAAGAAATTAAATTAATTAAAPAARPARPRTPLPTATPTPTPTPTSTPRKATRPAPARPAAPAPTSAARTAAAQPRPAPAPTRAPAATKPKGVALPLHFGTGAATRVITVVAHSARSTTATLQAWDKMPGGGWRKAAAAVFAHVGAQGLTRSPSESKSATPIGSFTLTHAFGRFADPGTSLPYLRTTPADWWISQPGPLYNTHQRCSGRCPFSQGAPNEHLYYTVPFYRYAVVIDYNTRNSGHVRQGAGSAFFLHVTDGNPTAGCVAIPQQRLVPLMRWLTRGSHPRILIGPR